MIKTSFSTVQHYNIIYDEKTVSYIDIMGRLRFADDSATHYNKLHCTNTNLYVKHEKTQNCKDEYTQRSNLSNLFIGVVIVRIRNTPNIHSTRIL